MPSTTGRTFVDTNVLVYAIDDGEPAKRDRARAILTEAEADDLILSTQVLSEFYVVVTRKLAKPMRSADAAAAVRELAKLPVVPTDATMVLDAVELSGSEGISLWDALIVQASAAAGCARILTEDLADDTEIAGVRIENPFRGD